jgi:hypothetical protein
MASATMRPPRAQSHGGISRFRCSSNDLPQAVAVPRRPILACTDAGPHPFRRVVISARRGAHSAYAVWTDPNMCSTLDVWRDGGPSSSVSRPTPGRRVRRSSTRPVPACPSTPSTSRYLSSPGSCGPTTARNSSRPWRPAGPGGTCTCGYRTRGTDLPRCGSTRRTSSGARQPFPGLYVGSRLGPAHPRLGRCASRSRLKSPR